MVSVAPGSMPSRFEIERMNRRHRLRLDVVEVRRAARHGPGVPVFELAAGDEHHRILRVRPLRRGDQVGGNEFGAPRWRREVLDKHHRVARIAFFHARIGDRRLALEAVPGDAGDRIHARAASR